MRSRRQTVALGLSAAVLAGWLGKRAIRVVSRRRAPRSATAQAGLVVLQIDGLAEELLKQAIAEGRMPTLAHWLERGSHRVAPWECVLPSQTSASQAGILYGDNFDIPAFRWYEKELRQLRVSNHPADAAVIAQRHSTGAGLLSSDGTSIANLVAGDAVHSFLTMSSFASEHKSLPRRASTFFAFFLDPLRVGRTLVLMLWEVVTELWQGQRQRLTDTRPRVARGLRTALTRSISNALLRELSVYLIRHDLSVGAAVIYCDFVGYDEVAHHAGPARSDALRVLWGIDRTIGALEQAARDVPRPYHFVVLSDHGQSQGSTFRALAGYTLEALIKQLIDGDAWVHGVGDRGEGLGHLSALISEVFHSSQALKPRLPRLRRRRPRRSYVALSSGRNLPEGETPRVVVCASGNLALIYFTDQPGRWSLESINATYPRLIEGLIARPEIGFLLVRSDTQGPMAIGRHGVHFLKDDRVEGEDPLARFGANAPDALRRLDSFPHTGDITAHSFFDPETEEVASFEELVGIHGGLGGRQTRPFLLIPAAWDCGPSPILGATAVYEHLQRWLKELAGDAEAAAGNAASGAAGSDSLQ